MNIIKLNKISQFIFISLFAFSLPLSISFSQIFLAIAFCNWLIGLFVTGKINLGPNKLAIPFRTIATTFKDFFYSTPLFVPIMAIGVVFAASTLFSPFPSESVGIFKKLILLCSIPLIILSINSQKQKHLILYFWLSGALVTCVWAIIQGAMGIERPGGFLGTISFGHFAAMALPIALAMALFKNNKYRRILAAAVFCTGAIAMLINQSRGGWLAVIVGITLVFVVRRNWLLIATFIVVLTAGCIAIIICMPDSELARRIYSVSSPLSKQQDYFATYNRPRWYKWKAAIGMAKDNPVLGVGPDQFKRQLPEYFSEEVKEEHFASVRYENAHNMYFDYAATMGIPGLLVLLFFIFSCFRQLNSKYNDCVIGFNKNLLLGVLASLVCFCMSGLTHQSMHDSETLMNICFLLGLALQQGENTKEISVEEI